MTYDTIYAAITTRVNDNSTTTTAVAQANLNLAYHDICSRHPFSWLLTTGTLTTTASQSYTIISTGGITDFWKVWTIREADTPNELIKIPMDKWERLQVISSDPTIPTHFSDQYDNRIYWYPTPDAVYSMYCRYWKKVTDLSTGLSPIIPTKYHEAVILGGWYRTMQYLKQYNEAQAIKSEYESMIEMMVDDDNDNINLVETQKNHYIGYSQPTEPQMPTAYRRY